MDLEEKSMNSFWTIFNKNDQCVTEESLRIFNFRLSIQDLAKVDKSRGEVFIRATHNVLAYLKFTFR